MESQYSLKSRENRNKKQSQVKNSTLLLIAFATAFFPRFFSYFGAPSIIDFFHFVIIPAAFSSVLLTSRSIAKKTLNTVHELLLGIFVLLSSITASALINDAGIINLALQFMFMAEPFLLLIAMITVPFMARSLQRFEYWLLGFSLVNLVLALMQSVLIPAGIYPKRGGTDQDAITGVFGGGGGSAANYISCTVSLYFALYFLKNFKQFPLWVRLLPLLGALYQIQVSDSKQVFLSLVAGWGLLVMTKFEQPVRLFIYCTIGFVGVLIASWALLNLESEFLSPYQNWIRRPIWGWDGLAAQTKFAMLKIAPSYFDNPLDWLFGLGPGHTVTRLGGWFLNRGSLRDLLLPLGATTHPASLDAWAVINTTYLPQESTIFFPMFTWIGFWGDLGIVGICSYFYLCSIVWQRVCVDDFGKFLMLSTFSFGWILTQMEEPGHMLTVACLLALSWQSVRIKNSSQALQIPGQSHIN